MKFLAPVSALVAFAASALAQTEGFNPIFNPEANQEIPAGKPFEITWEASEEFADQTISLHLIGGEDQGTQVPLADLAAGIPNLEQKFTWDVDASLGAENVYGIVLKLESNPDIFQFSNPFHIVGAEGGDDTTKTVSVSHGTKTVTLSSQKPTSTYTPTPTPTPTVTPTTYYTKPTSTLTKSSTTVEEEPQETETETDDGPAVMPTDSADAGARFGASSVALVGAFVAAAFAL